jgi:three-Cys-motif partner protein
MPPSDGEQFFEEQKLASRFKVEIYWKYLRPFCWKLLSRYPQLFIVDGYAGAGAYDPDAKGLSAAGSPLAAAQVAREMEVKYHLPRVQLINVESDPALFERLQTTLRPFPQLVTNIHGRFEDEIDQILATVGNAPTLFFVDPFGMKGADIRLIDKILDRRGKTITELLIHFSHKGFERMAGNLDAMTRTPQARKAAETKVSDLTGIIGSPWWQGIWRDPALSTGEKCSKAADLYRGQLKQRGIEFAHPIRMRDTYDGYTRYELVFATRSAHGVYLMSDTVAGYETDLFNQRYEGSFELQWKEHERVQARAALRDQIHAWGLALGEATPLQVYLKFAPLYFGVWRTSDYDGCLRELVNKGAIDRKTSHGIGPREHLHFQALAQGDLFANELA